MSNALQRPRRELPILDIGHAETPQIFREVTSCSFAEYLSTFTNMWEKPGLD